MHLHGFTARRSIQVIEGAKRLGESLVEYLLRLKAAGLTKSLPGTAAEVLDDEVRETFCALTKYPRMNGLNAMRPPTLLGSTQTSQLCLGRLKSLAIGRTTS